MIFWPLANIDYIINSFCNCDQFTEAIREVSNSRQTKRGYTFHVAQQTVSKIFICLSYKNDEFDWPFLFGDDSFVT